MRQYKKVNIMWRNTDCYSHVHKIFNHNDNTNDAPNGGRAILRVGEVDLVFPVVGLNPLRSA